MDFIRIKNFLRKGIFNIGCFFVIGVLFFKFIFIFFVGVLIVVVKFLLFFIIIFFIIV